MSGFGEKAGGIIGGIVGSKRQRDEIAKERRRQMQLLEGMDKGGAFEPMYASERAPTFQRSQSPVARSYLESFLMGNNPDATFSGAPDAANVKAQQQSSQNAMFGSPEERMAKQQEYFAQTPWAVKPPSQESAPGAGDARTISSPAVNLAQKSPWTASQGFTPEMLDQLEQQKLGGNEFSVADFFGSEGGTKVGSYLSEKQQRQNDRRILDSRRHKGNNLTDEVDQFVTLYQQDPQAALEFFNSSDLGKKYRQAAKQANGKAANRYKPTTG